MFHSFSTFRQIAKLSLFEQIFGEQLAEHLWYKFEYYNHDVNIFYCYLDTENANKLIEFIIKKST